MNCPYKPHPLDNWTSTHTYVRMVHTTTWRHAPPYPIDTDSILGVHSESVAEFARMMQRERVKRDAKIDRALAKRTDAVGQLFKRGKAWSQNSKR